MLPSLLNGRAQNTARPPNPTSPTHKKAANHITQRKEMPAAADREMAALPQPEPPDAESKATALLESLKAEFTAAEDNAVDSFFFETRAGTGGEEAALFARD